MWGKQGKKLQQQINDIFNELRRKLCGEKQNKTKGDGNMRKERMRKAEENQKRQIKREENNSRNKSEKDKKKEEKTGYMEIEKEKRRKYENRSDREMKKK